MTELQVLNQGMGHTVLTAIMPLKDC